MYFFSKSTRVVTFFTEIAFETNRDAIHVSKHYYLALKAICSHIVNNSERIGELHAGNSRKIVEIDESLILNKNIIEDG